MTRPGHKPRHGRHDHRQAAGPDTPESLHATASGNHRVRPRQAISFSTGNRGGGVPLCRRPPDRQVRSRFTVAGDPAAGVAGGPTPTSTQPTKHLISQPHSHTTNHTHHHPHHHTNTHTHIHDHTSLTTHSLASTSAPTYTHPRPILPPRFRPIQPRIPHVPHPLRLDALHVRTGNACSIVQFLDFHPLAPCTLRCTNRHPPSTIPPRASSAHRSARAENRRTVPGLG